MICQAITGERAAELELQPMVPENNSLLGTAFTVSIDARDGTSTGISASDRAATIAAVINPKSTAGDLLRPGHVFPLTAHPAGVLGRRGHTEAGVDLARMAGLYPSAVICEVMDADGNMARRPQLEKLAVDWGLRIASVQDIIAWRLQRELRRVAETGLPTDYGFFRLIAYNPECFALVKEGENSAQRGQRGQRAQRAPLVRIHSECLTGEALGSQRCDCGFQLHRAMSLMEEEGAGVIVYLRQEGRGVGLMNKIKAYTLQDEGMDTSEANLALHLPVDDRDYSLAAGVLADLGVTRCRLLTNNPDKIRALEGFEVERVSLETESNQHNRRYLETKKDKFGHLLSLTGLESSSE